MAKSLQTVLLNKRVRLAPEREKAMEDGAAKGWHPEPTSWLARLYKSGLGRKSGAVVVGVEKDEGRLFLTLETIDEGRLLENVPAAEVIVTGDAP